MDTRNCNPLYKISQGHSWILHVRREAISKNSAPSSSIVLRMAVGYGSATQTSVIYSCRASVIQVRREQCSAEFRLCLRIDTTRTVRPTRSGGSLVDFPCRCVGYHETSLTVQKFPSWSPSQFTPIYGSLDHNTALANPSFPSSSAPQCSTLVPSPPFLSLTGSLSSSRTCSTLHPRQPARKDFIRDVIQGSCKAAPSKHLQMKTIIVGLRYWRPPMTPMKLPPQGFNTTLKPGSLAPCEGN